MFLFVPRTGPACALMVDTWGETSSKQIPSRAAKLKMINVFRATAVHVPLANSIRAFFYTRWSEKLRCQGPSSIISSTTNTPHTSFLFLFSSSSRFGSKDRTSSKDLLSQPVILANLVVGERLKIVLEQISKLQQRLLVRILVCPLRKYSRETGS